MDNAFDERQGAVTTVRSRRTPLPPEFGEEIRRRRRWIYDGLIYKSHSLSLLPPVLINVTRLSDGS